MSEGKRVGSSLLWVIVMAMLGLVTILALCACRRATPTPQPPVTITFACPDDDLGHYEALAQAFKAEHPDLAIRIVPKRAAALAALGPSDADVFVVSPPLGPLIQRGALLGLNRWAEAAQPPLRDDLYGCAREAFSRNGELWAMPLGVDPVLMFYNKDLFDARNIPYPKPGWTWEDFVHAAQALRDYRQGVYGYAAGLWRQEPWLFILQHGGRVFDDWQRPTRVALDDPRTVEAMQWYSDLVFRLDISPTLQEASDAFGGPQGLYSGILDGKFAMWPGRFSARLFPARQAKLNWGVTVLPHGERPATLADVQGVAISAQTQHPQEAWEWVDFLSHQVPGRLAPARRSVAASPAFERQAGADAAAVVRAALENALVVPQEPAELYRTLTDVWNKAFEDIMTGRFAPAEALRQAQQRAK